MSPAMLVTALLSVPDLCPVCESHPADAAYLGCCSRGCEQAYHDEQERLRSAAPEVAAEASP